MMKRQSAAPSGADDDQRRAEGSLGGGILVAQNQHADAHDRERRERADVHEREQRRERDDPRQDRDERARDERRHDRGFGARVDARHERRQHAIARHHVEDPHLAE